MNALNQLRQSESRLIASVEAATRAVDAIGTGALDAALEQLHGAVSRARSRLFEALANVELMIGGVARDFEFAAGELEADGAAPVASAATTHQPSQDEPAAAEPVSVPPVASTQPEATQEAATANPSQEPDGIDLREVADVAAVGTDGTQGEPVGGVNRIAEALNAAPSANGHTGEGKARGRRRGKK